MLPRAPGPDVLIADAAANRRRHGSLGWTAGGGCCTPASRARRPPSSAPSLASTPSASSRCCHPPASRSCGRPQPQFPCLNPVTSPRVHPGVSASSSFRCKDAVSGAKTLPTASQILQLCYLCRHTIAGAVPRRGFEISMLVHQPNASAPQDITLQGGSAPEIVNVVEFGRFGVLRVCPTGASCHMYYIMQLSRVHCRAQSACQLQRRCSWFSSSGAAAGSA